MRKLLILICMMALTIGFASAEIEQVSSTSVFSTTATDYTLAHTLSFGPNENGYNLINVTTLTDASGSVTYSYKITASVDGGTEETLLETSFTQGTSDTYRTWALEKTVENGQTLTLREYIQNSNSIRTIYTRSIVYSAEVIPPDPYAIITPVTEDNTYTQVIEYYVSGFGTMNATIFIDGVSQGTEEIEIGNIEYIPDVSQGEHTWYVNVSAEYDGNISYNQTTPLNFTFDSLDPAISYSEISPDYDNIAVNTTVSINILWSDTNLKNASFYVDYGDGSGYILEDNISFTGTEEWFNATINTTGFTGNNVSWYQIAYDKAGNSFTYNDTFLVILDQLSIYVYDETTGDSLLPDLVKIYNTETSHFASIDSDNNVSTLSYSEVDTGKYIVSVSKDGYYTRNSIIDVDITTLSELNMYIISENETVIYDQFALTDYLKTYDYIDCIIRLDKPFTDGAQTVYSSYFDYNGIAATYLVASDQYLLYIITPDKTISYGWLTPDSDGEISIVINEFEFEDLEDWLQYNYEESDSSVTFEYESSKSISSATFAINNGTEIYNSTISTDTGSFTYLFEGDGIYQISISVLTEDGYKYVYKSVREIGLSQGVEFFPDSYSIVLKSLIVMFFIVVGVLGLSSYRADLAAIYAASLYAFSVYQEWCSGNEYTVSVVGILAIAAIVKFHRKNNRSLN